MSFTPVHARLRQFFLYLLCGGSGVAADFAIYAALIAANVDYQLANAAGYATGTVVSFFLNRSITFATYDASLRRFMMFCSVAMLGYLSSTLLLWFLIEQAGADKLLAKLLTLVIVIVIQFSLNTLITFRKAKITSPRI